MKALEAMGVETMTAEDAPAIIADISRVPCLAAYKEELLQGQRVKEHLAKRRQILMAQANATIERRFMEGLGAMVLNVDPELALSFRLKHGMGCLSDPSFRRWLVKNHPECAVKSVGKMMVRVDGLKRQTRAGAGGAHGARPLRVERPGAASSRKGSRLAGEPPTPFLAGSSGGVPADTSGHETMPAGARSRLLVSGRLESNSRTRGSASLRAGNGGAK